MSRTQQFTLLRHLASTYGLTHRVDWRHADTYKSYTYLYADGTALIALGQDLSCLGPYGLCCHEMAHVVAEDRRPTHGHKHDAHFTRTLIDVVNRARPVWPGPYPWALEYPRVYATWKRLTKEHTDAQSQS